MTTHIPRFISQAPWTGGLMAIEPSKSQLVAHNTTPKTLSFYTLHLYFGTPSPLTSFGLQFDTRNPNRPELANQGDINRPIIQPFLLTISHKRLTIFPLPNSPPQPQLVYKSYIFTQ
ncbi:hypothetical protein PGTUg99_002910 [Puccinia graminis f. sp. tritici]|uniref:Uncharacterized protein n=1 Tax=Puccinia graminis f. sp. tritici TaxID=56615 RepID=A0A5B0PSY9_PUCGR|nr:hypothetical protein PGTUg99_002910 [Puccinia graminis f. sp. tritici]